MMDMLLGLHFDKAHTGFPVCHLHVNGNHLDKESNHISLSHFGHPCILTWTSVGAADFCFGAVFYAGSTAILSGIFRSDPLLGAAATGHGADLPRAPGIPGAVD